MKELNVAVVGLGLQGERHARGFFKMPLVNLAAVCDLNEARGKKLAGELSAKYYSDFSQMLEQEKLDAVDISLPDNMHLEAIRKAVACGKHILVEKPMASTLEDAQAVYELVKDYDKVFTIGHLLRFDPRYSGAHTSVQSGAVGVPVSFYARRNSPIAGPLHYRGFTDLSMHVMVHDIDALEWILGQRITKVFAKKKDEVLREYGMTDCILATCTTEGGAIGCIEACWILPTTLPGSIDDKLEIIGTKGVIYTDSCDSGITIVNGSRADAPDSRHWPDINGEVSGDLYEELTDFVNCIIRGVPSVVTPADGLSTLKVVDAVKRSIASGKEEPVV